jgi:hypothetical protein
MNPTGRLAEIRERAKASHRDLVGLELEAGIAAKAEKLREEPPNFFSVYDYA